MIEGFQLKRGCRIIYFIDQAIDYSITYYIEKVAFMMIRYILLFILFLSNPKKSIRTVIDWTPC